MPSRRMFSSGAGGSRTRRSPRFELGRFADLRTAPFVQSALDGIWTRDLLRDRQASTPGCSTRACSFTVAQVGVEPTASLVLSQGGLPVAYRAAVVPGWSRTIVSWMWAKRRCRWTTGPCLFKWSHRESHPDLQRAMLASSCWTMTPIFSSGSRGARTHKRHVCRRLLSKQVPQPFGWLPYRSLRRRKPWDSNPQAVFNRHLFSRQAPHPAGWLPWSSCGGWNRTNMKTFRASHPAIR